MFKIMDDGDASIADLATEQVVDWGVEETGAESLWARGLRGEGVRVAVLDTGVFPHVDLSGAIDKVSGAQDTNGHGTHVSGIIGARDNGFGVVGVAPACILSCYNCAFGDGGAVADALRHAVDDGAQVINMSLGAYQDDPVMHDAVKYAYAAGVVMCAAAGNNHQSEVAYPAAYEEVIAVSAMDANLQKADFSPNVTPNHIMLPGVNVLSTWLDNQYARLTGTSQATPLMTGIVALIIEDGKLPRDASIHQAIHNYLTEIEKLCPDKIDYTPALALLYEPKG